MKRSIIIILTLIILLAITTSSLAMSGEEEIIYAKMDLNSCIHHVLITENQLSELLNSSVSRGSGDTEKVTLIQERLAELGYYTVEVDGVFGRYTDCDVRDFQEAMDITVDGIVGPETWKYLLSVNAVPYEKSGLEDHRVNIKPAVSAGPTTGSASQPAGSSSGVYAWGSYLGDYVNGSALRYHGKLVFGGFYWTFYSQRVLPGGGLNIPGRHVDSEGFVCDGDGYICLASPYGPDHSVYLTPFGRYGKAYDYCPEGNMDVYVDW